MKNNFFYNKSIRKVNRISFLFALFILFIFIFIVLYNTYNDYTQDLKDIEKNYLIEQKKFIKNETKRALRFIQYKYNTNIHKDLKSLQNEIVEVIENMRDLNNGTGYVFIYSFNGINIADPILKNNHGKNLLNFTDPNGKKVIKELIDISKKPNGGFVSYVWNKPTPHTLSPKISYATSFKPWNWMLGSGVYLDEIRVVLKKKKHQYQKQILIYLIEILAMFFIIFFIAIIFYRHFTSLLKNDIENIRLSLQTHEQIDISTLTFKEFKNVAMHTNIMTKSLKFLNTNLEKKIHQRPSQLEKSEKLALNLVREQDKFLKNAIHEINTPLSIIITNIDLFRLSYKNNKYITKIEAGSKIIHNIYNDLAYIIKKDRITYKKTNINFSSFLLQRIDFFYEIAKGNNLQIKNTIQNNINIYFNDTQLQRICDNLISNAIKYSYENCNITIILKQDDNYINLKIQNHSDNIKNIDDLFKRYYRENEARGGFGIGLNIIKDICNHNNVRIDVESKNNISIFNLYFKIGK